MKLSLFLNHACNLRCTYCYNGEKFSRPMSLETAKKGVDLALDNQGDCEFFTQISFFGGEPLLEMALICQIVDYAKAEAKKRDRRLRFVMVTNGSLLSEKRLEFFMENRSYLGISL
ncbi:MAG: radical SAM protein, partial [Proteobacteria bacterium]|nr:radical SAM protein [Pseudomonadota bacterium]